MGGASYVRSGQGEKVERLYREVHPTRCPFVVTRRSRNGTIGIPSSVLSGHG